MMKRMVKVVTLAIIGLALIAFAGTVETIRETFTDIYAAELSAEQMDVEGSDGYMAYSAAVRNLETIEDAAWIVVVLYGAGLSTWGLYKFFTDKE